MASSLYLILLCHTLTQNKWFYLRAALTFFHAISTYTYAKHLRVNIHTNDLVLRTFIKYNLRDITALCVAEQDGQKMHTGKFYSAGEP